jgi:outer membrane protein insertion porin family
MLTISDRKARAGDASPGFLRYLALGLVLAQFVVCNVSAEDKRVLRSISFVGNRAFSDGDIKAWMESREGGRFLTSDLERIVARYVDEGYPFARIDSLSTVLAGDSDTIALSIWLQEGKPAVVSSVRLIGVKSIDEHELRASLETTADKPFIPRALERDILSMLQLYERNGYPFAKIEFQDISFLEEPERVRVTVVLNVIEGNLAKLATLRVEGNTSTKADVILREARVAAGELFRGNQAEKIKRRLERLQLFSSVSLPELFVNADGSTGLLLRVAEGNPNRLDGIVGYVPSSVAGGSGYFTGMLNVDFLNILGTARSLSARWCRENQSTQEVELRYREPWVATYPVNAEVGFFQRKQDSTYVHRQYTLGADVLVADDWSVGLSFSRSNVFPGEGYGRRVISESQATSFGISASFDSRDDPTTPTEGFRYRTEYHTGVKAITKPVLPAVETRNATQRLTLDLDYFTSLFNRQVLALTVSASDFRTAAIELSDLFRLGGANTLRGYREAQFLGSRVAWSNVEYRFLVGLRSYVFGFVDAGYVFTPEQWEVGLQENEQTKLGYGVGVRLDSPLGLLGVSLAFGQGDTFSTAKLHIRLINEF